MDPAQRIANWNVKYNTGRIKATLDDRRPVMLASVTAVYPTITATELQIRQVCGGAGVKTIQIPFYLNFGRELWALSRPYRPDPGAAESGREGRALRLAPLLPLRPLCSASERYARRALGQAARA